MINIFHKIEFWFNNSRPYTIPITLLNWAVIFLYSIGAGGNILRGLVAYLGIFLVHLVTNLTDDYFDYIRLSKNDEFISKAKDSKCKYLKNGSASLSELKNVIFIVFCISFFIGLYLFFVSGFYVAILAFIGFIISLFYSKFSSKGFGDIAVIIAYGPLMFEGVYYVMCGGFSYRIFVLSIACGLIVNSILYSSMILDYDEDYVSGKSTLCTRLGSKKSALNAFALLYIFAYIFIIYFSYIEDNYVYCLSFFVIPLIFDLFNSLKLYNNNKNYLPEVKFWNYPLDNWNVVKNQPTASYFLRFFYTRNIAVWFLMIISFSIIIK